MQTFMLQYYIMEQWQTMKGDMQYIDILCWQ